MSKVLKNGPREHSAILSTFFKLPLVFKIFVLSIFEWSFTCRTVAKVAAISKGMALLLLIHCLLLLTLLNIVWALCLVFALLYRAYCQF